ncbi:MAG: hypothetical protein SOY80_03150 [Bacilli bacterium]|nr:hypothetical protein [Bacilli bacterium]
MKKIKYFLIVSFLLFTGVIFLIYKDVARVNIYNTLSLWLNNVLVALIPFYFLSNILINYPFISKIFYHLFNRIFRFENTTSCSLFLLSFITGNPTSSYLVISEVKNNTISIEEGNRLLRGTVLSSPLFTILMIPKWGLFIYLVQILVSSLLFLIFKRKNTEENIHVYNKKDILKLIDDCPMVMLTILSSMIFVCMFKIPLYKLQNLFKLNSSVFITFLIDSMELTTGLNCIIGYNIEDTLKVLLQTFFLSFGGLSIIVQILSELKKTNLSKTSLVLSRFIHGLISSLIMFFLMIFF